MAANIGLTSTVSKMIECAAIDMMDEVSTISSTITDLQSEITANNEKVVEELSKLRNSDEETSKQIERLIKIQLDSNNDLHIAINSCVSLVQTVRKRLIKLIFVSNLIVLLTSFLFLILTMIFWR